MHYTVYWLNLCVTQIHRHEQKQSLAALRAASTSQKWFDWLCNVNCMLCGRRKAWRLLWQLFSVVQSAKLTTACRQWCRHWHRKLTRPRNFKSCRNFLDLLHRVSACNHSEFCRSLELCRAICNSWKFRKKLEIYGNFKFFLEILEIC